MKDILIMILIAMACWLVGLYAIQGKKLADLEKQKRDWQNGAIWVHPGDDLSKAFDFIGARKEGGTIYFKNRTSYKINTPINLPPNITICGEGI